MNNDLDSFQTGVDSVYNACKSKGSTPSNKTLSSIITAINNIKTGIDTSDATATAALITKGYTAYVKGKKITGTRAAAIKSLNGSITVTDVKPSKQHIVTFSSSFDTVPTVKAVLTKAVYPTNGAIWTSSCTVTVANVTRTNFTLNLSHTAGSSYGFTFYIDWSASA